MSGSSYNASPTVVPSPITEKLLVGGRDVGRRQGFFATSQGGHSLSNPRSSPYQPIPNFSNPRLLSQEDFPIPKYPPIPIYGSDSHFNDVDDDSMTEREEDRDRREETLAEERPKLTVHYTDSIKPFQFAASREDSYGDHTNSRASSIAGTDYDDLQEYDWSGEEDLVDEEIKFEKQMGVDIKPQGFGPKRVLGFLFSSLPGSILMAGVLAAPALLVHFYWYKPNPTEHRRFIKDNIEAWLFWAAANLIISWWLGLFIDLAPIVTRFAIAAAWGHVSEYVKNRIEMYNPIKNNIKPISYAASAWISWTIIFAGIYKLFDRGDPTKSRASYTYRLSQVVEFLFFLALVIGTSRMLSHAIAFNFHGTAYKERIKTLEGTLSVIEKLRKYQPPRSAGHPKSGTRTPILRPISLLDTDHAKRLSSALRNMTPPQSSHGHEDGGDDADRSDVDNDATLVNKKGKKKNRRSWFEFGTKNTPSENPVIVSPQAISPDRTHAEEANTKQPNLSSRPLTPSNLNPHRDPPDGSPRSSMDARDGVIQVARVIKNAVLHDARNLHGDEEEDLAAMSWNIGSSHEAKRLARSIYMRFKDRRRNYLVPSDFLPVYLTEEAANNAFRVFDKDNNGDVSRAEIKTTLVKVYKERRFLSRSMRDVGEALKTLHYIILFLAGVILFFVSLSVFGVDVGNSLTSVYSIGIAASFIFKNAASSAFDAIMFLFVTHPYDTGDRCFVDDENLVVKKVGLFATVFARSDGTETYYFNSQLFNKFITNVRRSGKTFENLTMQVAWRTPIEKLDALEKCLNEWLSTEENRWFEPSTNITFQHIVYQRYLELTIGIGHNGNWQDWGLRNARRTAFHAAVQYYSRQLGITGYEAPLPIAYADPHTKTYNPYEESSPPQSPTFGDRAKEEGMSSPLARARREIEMQEIERAAKNMKPNLGFLPPLTNRESTLTRARKSKSRKTVLRGLDA